MPTILCTFTDTSPPRDYCNKTAFQSLWEYLLGKSDYDEVAVNLCPFAVPFFLEPGTAPVSLGELDKAMKPECRVHNWWEGKIPAPAPCLRVTFDPPPGSHPIRKEPSGRQIPPDEGWNMDAIARTAAELRTATNVSFKGELVEDTFQRGWEDKGLFLYPVDYSFRPDPARLAEAWAWLDMYLVGAGGPIPMPPDSELADGKALLFRGEVLRYMPVGLPDNYRFDRMFFWTNSHDVFFQPSSMDSRCPFCGATVDFKHVGDALTSHVNADGKLTSLDFVTPCCSRATTVNELDFDGSFGIGKFSIRFSSGVDMTEKALDALSQILGTRLKMLYSHR